MKAKVSRKSKSNVVYISSYKKRNIVKAYTKTDDDWYDITRANDSTKKLSDTAAKLCSKLEYELHKNNDRPVYLTPYWFVKVTKKQRHQNARLRGQINHIFNFEHHKKIIVDGELLSNVYETWHTLESRKIMNLEDVISSQDTPSKPHEVKLLSWSKNAPPLEQKCSTYMYDKEKEEEPLVHSSSFSNNEKLKIKSFSEPEPAPQEPIIEIPTLATSSLAELAKVYQTEEIRVVETEVVTNCDRLAELRAIQDIPILANFLNPCDESPVIDKMSTVHSQTTEKHEEITEMKAQQIPLEPERNVEFELSGAIFKSFGSSRSDEIMDHCKFILITPSKLGVQVSNGFSLSANDKDTLKACIRLVYGNSINIVSSAVVKIAQPETKFLQEPQKQPNNQRWERFKKELLSYFPEKTGGHILNTWFDKLRVSEDTPNNRIILTGSTFYVDSVYSRFERAIENVVKKHKVTLELHYENNDQRPRIYKPNGGF